MISSGKGDASTLAEGSFGSVCRSTVCDRVFDSRSSSMTAFGMGACCAEGGAILQPGIHTVSNRITLA